MNAHEAAAKFIERISKLPGIYFCSLQVRILFRLPDISDGHDLVLFPGDNYTEGDVDAMIIAQEDRIKDYVRRMKNG